MKKQGVAPNFCPVLCRIKIKFKIKYFRHTLFNYNIMDWILSGLNLCQKNTVRREQEPSELLDLGQQWAAETSLVGLEQLWHILHILDQKLQASGKLFLFMYL